MKYLAWIFAPAMLLGLAACDNAGEPGGTGSDSVSGSAATDSSPAGGPAGPDSTASAPDYGSDASEEQSASAPPATGGG